MSPVGESSRIVLKGSREGGEASSVELSDYVLEPLREDEEFILLRGHARHAEPASVLLLAPASTHPTPETLRRMEHEYSFKSRARPELGGAASCARPTRGGRRWCSRPRRRAARSAARRADGGGHFLRLAIGLAAAVGQVHRRASSTRTSSRPTSW